MKNFEAPSRVHERWACVPVNDKLPTIWVDIVEVGLVGTAARYHYDFPIPPVDLLSKDPPKHGGEVLTIGSMPIEEMRSFIHAHVGKSERCVWHGPVPAETNIWTMPRAEIEKYQKVDVNTANLAFRLEYRDKTFNLDAAIKAAQGFVHDAILAAMSPPHEPLEEVQVTVTFNKPKKDSTQLVVAKEGSARSPDELGFRKA